MKPTTSRSASRSEIDLDSIRIELSEATTTADRTKIFRRHARLSQAKFGGVLVKGDGFLSDRAISDWETGKAAPLATQVGAYRENLVNWMIEQRWGSKKLLDPIAEAVFPLGRAPARSKKALATSKSETGKQPEHSQAETSPDSLTPPPGTRGSMDLYHEALEKMAKLIAGIDADRARESLSTGNSSEALGRAYQRLGALLRETLFIPIDLNFVRLYLEQVNDWRERSRLLEADDLLEVADIDSAFRAEIERFGARQRESGRILEHDLTRLKIVRNQHGQLWLILTEEEFRSRFPQENVASLVQVGAK